MDTPLQTARRAAAVAIPLLFLAISWLSAGDSSKAPPIVADAKIQSMIRRVANPKGDEVQDAKESMNALDSLARKTPEVLAPQVVYYSLQVKDEKEAFRVLGLMKYLATNWGSEMRRGLIPLLETRDEPMLREVTGWLAGIDNVASPSPQELSVLPYRELLLRHKKNPPVGLINYIFDHAPSNSMLLLGEVYSEKPLPPLTSPRDLTWSNHIVTTVRWRLLNDFLQDGDLEKARKELNGLSKHQGWYARRYVVETLNAMPKLGTPEIVNRLKNDPNQFVALPAKQLK